MIEVKLHDIGEGLAEGDILTYLVKKATASVLISHWWKFKQQKW